MTSVSSPMVYVQSECAPVSGELRARADRWLLGIVVGVALLCRLSFIAVPFWSDSGIYIYMGKVVATGGHLYQDFFETKFPGVALMIAPLWKLFGSWWPGYVLVQTAMAFASAVLLGRTARRYVSEDAGRSTLLFAIVFVNFSAGVFTGFQLETIQIFFTTIAGCLAIRWILSRQWWGALLVGLFAGIAGIIKPTGMASLGAFAIAAVIVARKDSIKALLFAALGAAIPIALVFAWTVYANLLGEMPELLRQISLYGNQTTLLPEDLMKVAAVATILGFPMILRWRCPQVESTPARAPQPALQSILLFASLWLFFECIGILAQRRMYMYYFLVLAPPCAILFGLIPRPARAKNLAWALVPALVYSLFYSAPLLAKFSGGFKRAPLTEYLVAHTKPNDPIFADWMPRILLESDLQPGSRYPHLWYFGNHDLAPLDYTRVLLNDFEQRKPVYVVIPAKLDEYIKDELAQSFIRTRPVRAKNVVVAWDRIRSYLAQNYKPETTVGIWQLYRRNETP
ncbi:MAG TPA: glycosyltransferase family 39 protein [Tepidisphaeraceae bacterium]|nr:glycosyltransferase family 39 protein [Tepidisphaeraceae bacterium]